MPRSLIGHCFAPLGTNRVLVAGGYSIEDGDYTKGVDIYDFDTGQWFTKPWMPLANGPRIDASCANVWLRGKQRIVIAGGWNNMDMRDTEFFDPLSNILNPVNGKHNLQDFHCKKLYIDSKL